MTEFKDLGLADPILRAVTKEGYTTPTPIQAKAIPILLQNRDVTGIAQTGTGKTAAFVLPLLNKIFHERHTNKPKCCSALILAPTRELASQIAEAVRVYGRNMKVKLTVVVGGVKPRPQIKALSGGCDIVVATPGRLEDHMRSGALRLDETSMVILDEADQMFDLGFQPAIRRIMAKLPRERQTLLFSATMPKPIRALANEFQSSPVDVSVAPAARPIDRIDQRVMAVNAAEKRNVLVKLLNEEGVDRAIVFTRTKRGADKVCKHLDKVGFSVAAIHGDKSQGQRTRALASFRSGSVPILVATDVAARGIDIDDVSHVFNFELPNVPEAYVHRIGRTARAGKEGIAIAFCDPSERSLLRDIERLIGRKLTGDGTELPDVDESVEKTKKQKSPRNKPHWSRGRNRSSRSNNKQGKAARPNRGRTAIAV